MGLGAVSVCVLFHACVGAKIDAEMFMTVFPSFHLCAPILFSHALLRVTA